MKSDSGCGLFDFAEPFQSLAEANGFPFFMVLESEWVPLESKNAQLALGNWTSDFFENYDGFSSFERFSVLGKSDIDNSTVDWELVSVGQAADIAVEKSAPCAKQPAGKVGVNYDIQFGGMPLGSVSFARENDTVNQVDFAKLGIGAANIYTELLKTGANRPSSQSGLTLREIECLDWTSKGKTSSEIAVIIGLSEHTINAYLFSACNKLNAVNRVHAVSKAIRNRLI